MIITKIKFKLLNYICGFLSPLIKLAEKNKIYSYGNKPLMHQPVFIIGAPRTGSTILYQAITNKFDVLYIDNLVAKWYRNFFYGFKRSIEKFGNRPHNVFKSVHGNTGMYSSHAPSECGEFWYRWFPRDRHFLDSDDIADDKLEEIRLNITSIINYYDSPLVFKNLNAGQRLRVLKKIFPDAKFIWIRRDIIDTCVSMIKAKRNLGLDLNEFWSIMPRNVDDLKSREGYEQVVLQIYNLEKQIEEDKKLFSNENFFELNYEEFRKNSDEILESLRQFMGNDIGLRLNAEDVCFDEVKRNQSTVDAKEVENTINRLKLENGFEY